MNRDLILLKEYLDIYIQLLEHYVAPKHDPNHMNHLPTFEYFKENYNSNAYSLNVPGYIESKRMVRNEIHPIPTHGLGSEKGIASRYYNYWMGHKFYTYGNIEGNYTIHEQKLNTQLKTI